MQAQNTRSVAIIGAILEYFEGKRTFRSVLVLGLSEQAKSKILQNKYLAEVISDLNDMANDLGKDKVFSREETREAFTSMLEKLLKD